MDINNMELLNDSGLSSLSGFSYQIKVFILRLTQLQQGQRVEFETLDDVAVNKNFFRYYDEESSEEIRLDEYRAKLNVVFSKSQETMKELRAFVEEDIGYRTFTVFNFLGENRQGILND